MICIVGDIISNIAKAIDDTAPIIIISLFGTLQLGVYFIAITTIIPIKIYFNNFFTLVILTIFFVFIIKNKKLFFIIYNLNI